MPPAHKRESRLPYVRTDYADSASGGTSYFVTENDLNYGLPAIFLRLLTQRFVEYSWVTRKDFVMTRNIAGEPTITIKTERILITADQLDQLLSETLINFYGLVAITPLAP